MFADLSKKINSTHLNPDWEIHSQSHPQTLPTFSQVRAGHLYDQTSSPHLDKVLKWEEDKWASADSENHQQVAYNILVDFLA